MAYWIEGDYFDACSCTVSCPCIFLNPATEDFCDNFFAWHISRGEMDGVDLAGLNVAMAVHSPKQMQDGNWKVVLYLDERANPEQADALQAIFGGQAGGHFASLAPLVGEVAGVIATSIVVDKTDGARRIEVHDALEMRVEELGEETGEEAMVFTDAPFMAVPQGLRQARSEMVRYRGVWNFETSGRNAFINEFRYEA
ncbi:MAG TPA: DUF1326 domain-containing protein [Gaiellaceae bacterium]|nr:DUF1326 domain-containing protein [Gaiellaceae bacterium]